MNIYNLRIHPFAEFDIEDAKDWHNIQEENLGNEFIIEIEKSISQMLNNPNQFPKINKGIRKVVIKRFPYSIFYRVISDTIELYAVLHNSRNPILWKHRLK